MSEPLRSDEIVACVHRVALNRGQPFVYTAPQLSAESARRQRDAHVHRQATLEEIAKQHHDAVEATSLLDTTDLMRAGAPLILRPRLKPDTTGLRRGVAHVLVRTGRHDDAYTYAPIIVKNNEIIEVASTRRLLEGSLERLLPGEATFTDGYGPRSTSTMIKNGIALAHVTRVLQAHGYGDPLGRGAIVDRHRRLWWFDLVSDNYPRFNLATYDRLYHERRSILRAHDEWRTHGGPFPTQPYWHRECPDCPYAAHCEAQLEARDDVSLTRYTNAEQQILLRDHGINTRAQLAHLDPHRARAARNKVVATRDSSVLEDHLGRSIDKLDDLIYRARAHLNASPLRIENPADMGCPTADIEVDIDMESYNDTTYLWGAYVTVNTPVQGVQPGYRAFAVWDELNAEVEAENFAEFWRWFDALRRQCQSSSRSVAAYCFWAQAEDGAMNRAVIKPVPGGPTRALLDEFRQAAPSQWIDLHEYAKRQIQTTGPLGLKQLARASGFDWRDANPSGEASMLWYEVAVSGSPEERASRQRILDYNEDDCRATKALRDWLNGPAKLLPHRDEVIPQSTRLISITE